MPYLTTRMIFISHAWKYDKDYWTLVEWFNDEPNFTWKNYSVPKHDACGDITERGLKNCLTRQIRPANMVIILGGMYTVYSEWIDYEIDEAARIGKIILGVRPWGQEKMPLKIQNTVDKVVGWNRKSNSSERTYISHVTHLPVNIGQNNKKETEYKFKINGRI